MTTILEEDDGQLGPVDFSQLLPDVSHADTSEALVAAAATVTTTAEPPRPDQCPLHPDLDECLCNGFVGDWDLPEPLAGEALAGIQEPDYSRFDHWIPRFIFPEKPCDYCRSRRLNCYVQRGEPFCTACRTLFRECSFTGTNTLESMNYVDKASGTFLDTLHLVDEDLVQEWGGLTGVKPLKSKPSGSGTATPIRDDAPGSSKRNGIRFPRHAVKILRDWLDQHAENPYPTEDEKAELEQQTELKPSQIANWLANARRRRKVTEKSKPKLCASPSLRPTTCPIPIPSTPEKLWNDMNPFERWQHSPPENEPADLSDIAIALAKNDVPADVSTSPSTLARSKRRRASSNGSGWSNARAPSLTSQETGQTSTHSASSARFSNGSSHSTHGSFGSFSSSLAGKKDRRRKRRQAAPVAGRKPTDEGKRIFQCTFCTDTFKSKYDWTRHEKSLHLSLEKWICAPLGPILTDQECGDKKCVYCDLHNPSSDHLESHNHRQCEDKGLDARTFYRKDHLRQHLRLMHGCEMTPAMDKWKFTAVNINSRCGFCAQRFSVWQERVDHLTAHFKAGARMSEWKGCRGLDPAVAAQVTNAMPPYLIGIESVSPNPFSATNRTSWRQDCPQEGEFPEGDARPHNDMQDAHDGRGSSKATCWEILTVRLGKYAKRMADQNILMSDDMLQAEARRILYGSNDAWDQTAADNPEWLDLFKKAHGLDFIPSAIGGQGKSVPEDLETYGDLGLRIPFAVQLQAYNQAQSGQQRVDAATRPGPYKVAVHKRKAQMQQVYKILSVEGVLHDDAGHCKHTECEKNAIDTGMIDEIESSELQKWCDKDITPEMRQRITRISYPETIVNIQDQEGFIPGLESILGDSQTAAAGRAQRLAALSAHEKTHSCCEWENHDRALLAARARTHGLEALARAEAPLVGDGLHKDASPAMKKAYLPRHKLELPKEKANLFATTTNAWEDAGVMPQTVVTSLANIPETTSTGAMMEFLGGNIGASLPFSHDALTSTIDLPAAASTNDSNWHLPDISQQEMMDLFNSTTAGQFDTIPGFADTDMNWSMDDIIPAQSIANAPDLTMHDIGFDDMNFDSVFDMPLDETFGPDSGSM